jgi:hypothetical protein
METMESTIIWGFCSSDGREIVTDLRAALNITDWFSDQESSMDIWCFLLGNIPITAERSSDAIHSFAEFYQQYFQVYCVMISRRGLNFSNIHKLTNEFALTYYYFYELLRKKKTGLVIFSNLPHEGPEYILYQVAKSFRIKTLMCYQSILPNQFFLTTMLDDFGCFQSIPEIFKNTGITIKPGHKQNLFYMRDIERQQAVQQKAGLELLYVSIVSCGKRLLKLLVNIFNLLKKPSQLNIEGITKILENRNLKAKYEKQINQHAVDRKILKQLLDTSKHLVYFPLHLQPELSTSAIGGIFQDQLYAIETLSALLGNEWIIFVKENPKQDFYQRDELFFDRLDQLPRVYWVDKLFPSLEIIEKAALTATITGTAGWETIKGGGKCLVFGQAWYATLENCLSYHAGLDMAGLANFLAEEKSFTEFSQSFERLLKKAGVGVVDKYYNVLVNGYSPKSNAENVTKSLMAVINHPATVWR